MSKKSIHPARRSPRRRASEVSTLTLKYADTILAPLRRTEAVGATKLALAAVLRDGTIRAERTRIYGPTLRIEKPKRRGGAPARIVWIRIRNRDLVASSTRSRLRLERSSTMSSMQTRTRPSPTRNAKMRAG
jgi:hypothetical protein